MIEPDRHRPRIGLVITALHGVAGGAERVLCDVANGLHERGYDVTVITDQQLNGPTFYQLDYGIRRLDGRRRHGRGGETSPIRAVNRMTDRGPVFALGGWLLRYGPKVIRTRRMLAVADVDVCIGFLPSSFPYVELARVGRRCRTIASLHNVPERDLGGDPGRWDQNPIDISLRLRGLRTADAVTVLLPSFVEQLEPAVRAKTHVVPNLVHPHEGPTADVDVGNDNVILAVGRLAAAKDHATLVRAWSRIEAAHPSWRVRIIGDGPLGTDLRELIKNLELTRVTIDEPTDQIGHAYSTSKIFAMPSLYEGFGLVTVEAMAAGLPVVGFADCEGTNEIVLDGVNGLLVSPGDDRDQAFADALERLILDPQERRRLATGAPSSAERYSETTVLDQWERVIAAAWGARS